MVGAGDVEEADSADAEVADEDVVDLDVRGRGPSIGQVGVRLASARREASWSHPASRISRKAAWSWEALKSPAIRVGPGSAAAKSAILPSSLFHRWT